MWNPTGLVSPTHVFLFCLCFPIVFSQLDNENMVVGVYMESGMIEGERSSAENQIKKSAEEASSQMEKGSLTVQMLLTPEELASDELTAAMTVTSCDSLHSLAMEHIEEEKLHVAITNAGCMRVRKDTAMTVPLVNGQSDVVQLITDMREKNTLTWSDIVIIHDGAIAPHNLDIIMNRLNVPTDSASHVTVVVIDISNLETDSMKLGTVFKELGPRPGEPKERQFLAIVSKDQVASVQNIANTMMLMGPKYQWLFVVPDTNNMDYSMASFLDSMKDGDNLAFMYNVSDKNANPASCNTGYDCYLDSLIRSLAREYSKELKTELDMYFQVSEEEWEEIKPSQKKRAEKVVQGMKSQHESIPTCATCTNWAIQAAEVRAADRIELLDVADWLPTTGLVLMDDLFPHITGGFRGRTVVIASLNYPPWQIFRGNGEYTGLIFEVVKTLGQRLNFSFVVLEPPDNAWGTQQPSGKWNGMVNMVINKDVLFAAAAFTVSTSRLTVVNFTKTIDLQPYTFMIARPKELSRVLIFIKPFTNNMWIYIGVTVLIMGPILWIVTRFSPFYEFHELNDGRGLFQLQNCSWYVYGAILQQGGTKLPMSDSGRLVVGSWWVFVIVVVTTYSGNLVAFLTFPQIENAVSSLDDLLVAKDDMSWGFTKDTVLEEYFQTAEGKFKDVGDLSEKHSPDEMVNIYDRVRLTPHALLEWKSNLLFTMKAEYNRTDTCDFSLGREEFYFESVAMPMPKDSPYIEMFDKEIKRMQLGGLIEKWKKDFWPKKDKCSSTAYGGSGETRTVSLSDMQGSFFILFMGFVVSLVMMIGEFILQSNVKSLPGTPTSTKTLVKSFVA